MSINLANHVAPVEFMTTDAGQVYIYVSDVLADGGMDAASMAALAWAVEAVDHEDKENNLALTLDIPASVAACLDFYNEDKAEGITIALEVKPQFDVLRAKLEEAIKIIDSVRWIE
jgi:hypothetical protein